MKIEIVAGIAPKAITRAASVSLNGKTQSKVLGASEYGGWVERLTGKRDGDAMETEVLKGEVKIHGLTPADRKNYAARHPEYAREGGAE